MGRIVPLRRRSPRRRPADRYHRPGHFKQPDLPQPLVGRAQHGGGIRTQQGVGHRQGDAAPAIESAQRLADIESQLVRSGGREMDPVILAHLRILPVHIRPVRGILPVLSQEPLVDIEKLRPARKAGKPLDIADLTDRR